MTNILELLDSLLVNDEYDILEETSLSNIEEQLTTLLSSMQEHTILLESFNNSNHKGLCEIEFISSKIIYFITKANLYLSPFQNDYVKNILEKFSLKFSLSDSITNVSSEQFLILSNRLKIFLTQILSLINTYLTINNHVLVNFELLEISNIEIIRKNSIKLKLNKFQLLDTLDEIEPLKSDYELMLKMEYDKLIKQKETFMKLRTIYIEIRTDVLGKFLALKTSLGIYLWMVINTKESFVVEDDILIFKNIIKPKPDEIMLLEDIDTLLEQYNKWENDLYGKKTI